MNIKKEKRSLKERGLHSKSYFEVEFEDGTIRKEHDTNWSDISNSEKVTYIDGRKRTQNVSKILIKRIKIFHNNLSHEIVLKKDERVFQFVRMRTTFLLDGTSKSHIVGRGLGLVNSENEIVEEVFLSEQTNEVVGFKYTND